MTLTAEQHLAEAEAHLSGFAADRDPAQAQAHAAIALAMFAQESVENDRHYTQQKAQTP